MMDIFTKRQAKGITVARGSHPDWWARWAREGLRTAARLFQQQSQRMDPATYIFPAPKKVQLGAITLNYLQWESDLPTILLIHGLNANAWMWAREANLLRKDPNVISVDLRGYGNSTSLKRGYSLEETTEDLLAFLDHVAPGKVDLAAHSWGGMVATHLAGTDPDRFRSLSLADPVLPQGLNRLYRTLDKLIDAIFAAERGPFPDEAAWKKAASEIIYLQWDDELDHRYWSANFTRLEDGSYQPVLPDSAFEEIFYRTLMTDSRAVAQRIKCPTLLMLPSSPINFLPGEYRWIRRTLFPAERRLNGDHSFIHSNPVDTAHAMLDFLKKH